MTEETYTKHFEKGAYHCSQCGAMLFDSESKFSSGTQWPSFRKGKQESIATKPDHSQGMDRTEILCKNCGQHLGHVFDEGRLCGDKHTESGKRYCVLSESLKFEKKI